MLLLAAVALVAVGILALWPVRSDLALKQCLWLVLAMGGFAAVQVFDYQRAGRGAYPFLIVVVVMLVFVLLPIVPRWLVPVRNGARRWITLGGFSLQPSELAKLALVLALARYLRFRDSYRRFRGLAGPFAISLVPLVLILREPDLGTVLLMVPVLFAVLFAAGARAKHLLGIIALAIAAVPVVFPLLRPHQRARIVGLFFQSDAIRQYVDSRPSLRQWLYPRGATSQWRRREGYQLLHSKLAIGSGGAFGFGYGKGPYVKYPDLPDRHNDFLFAMIGHQWGLVGAMVVLLLFACIAVCGLEIAARTKEPFGRLAATGLVMLILLQALVNIAMTVGLTPVTGLTLPFVSYGGSSLLVCFVSIGLLVNIARHRRLVIAKEPFDFDGTDER